MVNTFSDKTIALAIIILILLLLKGFNYLFYLFIFQFGLYDDRKETKNTMEKIYDFLNKYLIYASDLLDTILLFVACYILFIKKHNNILTIIFCLMLILKFILHFLMLNRFETYFGIKNILDDKTIKKLSKIKAVNSFITNIVLFIAASYMLKIIFLN